MGDGMDMVTEIDIKDFAYRVPDEFHDQACEGGWINVEHPVRPGVIMQRLPCATCNADASKSDPWSEPVFTVSYPE